MQDFWIAVAAVIVGAVTTGFGWMVKVQLSRLKKLEDNMSATRSDIAVQANDIHNLKEKVDGIVVEQGEVRESITTIRENSAATVAKLDTILNTMNSFISHGAQPQGLLPR